MPRKPLSTTSGKNASTASFRCKSDGAIYITDNGNGIIDIAFSHPLESPEKTNETIRAIPGVLETGFFFNLARRVLIGHLDGTVDSF